LRTRSVPAATRLATATKSSLLADPSRYWVEVRLHDALKHAVADLLVQRVDDKHAAPRPTPNMMSGRVGLAGVTPGLAHLLVVYALHQKVGDCVFQRIVQAYFDQYRDDQPAATTSSPWPVGSAAPELTRVPQRLAARREDATDAVSPRRAGT